MWKCGGLLCLAAAAGLGSANAVQELERKYDGYDFTVYVSDNSSHSHTTIAWAHGFGLDAGKYSWVGASLAAAGHVVVLPHTRGAPESKGLALAAAAGAAGALNESKLNASSPLFGRVSEKWAAGGHSMGGGTSFLSADPSILAGKYAPPSSVLTFSAGAWTIPKAETSAPRIANSTPALMLTATQDCIDPPGKNSVPLFNDLTSACKGVVSIVGGCHCQYAGADLGCETTEKLCGAKPNITRVEQQDTATLLATAWLRFVDGADPFDVFQGTLASIVASGKVFVMDSDWSRCGQ
eukprot:Hpha_TRINITY_DN10832_c0_g1::TRINITY_DN10832_c0_g1_i2::g.23301::m.23301